MAFCSVHAIARNISPLPGASGIQSIEYQGASPFSLHCLQTLTGLKIIITTSPNHASSETLLRKIYELYADYALKNPYQMLEMPIRSELFDQHLLQAIK